MTRTLADSGDSQITLVGTNYKYAPIETREQLWCQPQSLPKLLKSITQSHNGVREAVVLSTCNRTEIYVFSSRDTTIREYLTKSLSDWSGLDVSSLRQHVYSSTDEEAVYHLIGVAAGLDSLVVGEQQIQAQVKNAAKIANQAGTLGRYLSELFHYAYRSATEVRTQSGIGLERASVSSAAVSLLRHVSGNKFIESILLVGAGKMITLAVDDLATFGKAQVWVANRTFQRAKELAERFGGKPLAFDEIPNTLREADAVLACTSAPYYVIKARDLEAVMPKRAGRSLILIDASVPRNIDPEAAKIPGVQLFNIDDLAPYVKLNDKSQQSKVEEAEQLVRKKTESFYARIRAFNANETLKDLRRIAEEIREKELSRALRRLGKVSDREREVVDLLTRRIVNKLLYEPTTRLKEHASNGDGETYEAVIRELFSVDRDNRQ